MLNIVRFRTPSKGITPLVGQIQTESEAHRAKGEYARVYVFHNRPEPGAFMSQSVKGCCRSMRNGCKVSPESIGRPGRSRR